MIHTLEPSSVQSFAVWSKLKLLSFRLKMSLQKMLWRLKCNAAHVRHCIRLRRISYTVSRSVMTRILIVLCTLPTVIGPSLAQTEESTVTTLSCDGTTKVYVQREEGVNPVTKMIVVVNVAERTVLFDGRIAHIDHIGDRTILLGGDSVKDTTGYIDGKTGAMTATNMDSHEYYELVCPAATGAFSELHDIAAPDSGKVEVTHQRTRVSAHDRRKMKKASPEHTPE